MIQPSGRGLLVVVLLQQKTPNQPEQGAESEPQPARERVACSNPEKGAPNKSPTGVVQPGGAVRRVVERQESVSLLPLAGVVARLDGGSRKDKERR